MVKNGTHKIRGLHRILKKPDSKINSGSVSAQGQKTGAAAETVQEQENSTQKKLSNKKMNVFKTKLSAVAATANFQQKKG